MTDFEKFSETFNQLNITHKVIKEERPQIHEALDAKYDTCIILDNSRRYNNIECCFFFLDGKYVKHTFA